MRRTATSLLIIALLSLAANAFAGEIVRFDFQEHDGEGQYELFRLEVDITENTSYPSPDKDTDGGWGGPGPDPIETGYTVVAGNGEFCYLHTEDSNVPDKVTKHLWEDAIWTGFMDIKDYDHACFKFDLHEPFGWFYSPVIKYSGEDYMFFFVGDISSKELKGTIYEFFTATRPDGGKDKFYTKINVSAKGIPVKK